MAKKLYEEENIRDIACAIREKCGDESRTYKCCDMADAIRALEVGGGGSGGDITVTDLTWENNINHIDDGGHWDWFIENYADKITTKDLTASDCAFSNSDLAEIPIVFNFTGESLSYMALSMNNMFEYSSITTLPIIKKFVAGQMGGFLSNAFYIREFPENYTVDNEWTFYNTHANYMSVFSKAYSLRHIDSNFLRSITETSGSYEFSLSQTFSECYSLDEISNLAVDGDTASFYNTFYKCGRLKKFTFATDENGNAIQTYWKGTTLDLSSYVGYLPSNSTGYVLNYNSGITADKEVTNETTYQALKNDPDWFTTNINYSRYNHNSAVETINSLPIKSSSSGTNNTIKFKGASGASTDGGAVNALTETEIAVATAKGWTVSFV